jgi:hypothetical protein
MTQTIHNFQLGQANNLKNGQAASQNLFGPCEHIKFYTYYYYNFRLFTNAKLAEYLIQNFLAGYSADHFFQAVARSLKVDGDYFRR